jgi:Anti-sigma factor NepR
MGQNQRDRSGSSGDQPEMRSPDSKALGPLLLSESSPAQTCHSNLSDGHKVMTQATRSSMDDLGPSKGMKHEISTHFSETQVGPNEQDLKTVSDSLGRQLRAIYGELVSAPVPDRILDLLNRLQTQDHASASGAKATDEETPL